MITPRVSLLCAILTSLGLPVIAAAPLDRATITEAVNSVNIIDRGTGKQRKAEVKQEFAAPNVMRTGGGSRAELVAADNTVTRVGSNTLFSFQGGREIELEKGTILFNPQPGKGGGTIKTQVASAAVLGTTMIVSTTPRGGCKVLVVEGKAKVKPKRGRSVILRDGEMVLIEPNAEVQKATFRIKEQVAASNLFTGFRKKLPSSGKIKEAADDQEKDLSEGSKELNGQPTPQNQPHPLSTLQLNKPKQEPKPEIEPVKPVIPKPEPKPRPEPRSTPRPPRPPVDGTGGTSGGSTGPSGGLNNQFINGGL